MIRHRFSAEDFHKMAEAGILGEDDRVELIRGEVVDLVREKVHVFRRPQGEAYGEERALEDGELSVLGLKVPVKEVLP